jgi:uncharacterized membrane protein YozB (DUF420 family)
VRWRLLFITSFAAAILALAVFSGVAIAVFGSVDAMTRNQLAFVATSLLPLALAAVAGVFAYRHTARRRRTQAFVAAILTLALFSVAYAAASWLFPEKLSLNRERVLTQVS